MATITTDDYLDSSTARTAGESWTLNGGKLTIRTDTRWHSQAPASMTGSLSNVTVSATLGGGVLIDARNVRWLPYDTGTGNVPAIGTTITQSGNSASGYLLGVWDTLTSAPTAVGAAMPANGFIKFREVTSGPFTTGALTGIGASATGADVTGWIEVVQDQSATNTISRKGTGHVTRGDWFYLDNTDGTVAQVLQVPTNGGGANTYCPGVWIETGVGTDEYEFWPGLNGSTNGWTVGHLGAPEGGTDRRQNFVKSIGSGQMQIGESVTQSSTYSVVTQSSTYTWANDVVTVTFTAHGLAVGQEVYIDFTSGGATADGVYTVESVTGANSYTVALAGAGTNGNASVVARTTVTFTAHGLAVGQRVYIDATSGTLADGTYEIMTVPDANSYTISTPQNITGGTGNATAKFTIGNVPESGCKTRVPNIFLRQCTTGARATNAAPNGTIANRPDFTTTGAGVVDHEFTYGDWYYLTLQAYQTRLHHVATFDAVSIAECATALDLADGGCGMYSALDTVVLTLTSNFAGGTIDLWKFPRGNTPGTNDHAVTITTCSGIEFSSCEASIVQFARSSGYGWTASQSDNLRFLGCRQINGGTFSLTTCANIEIQDLDHVDRFNASTNSTSATYTVTLASKCSNVMVDTVTEGYSGAITRQHAYSGILSSTACTGITLRNCGTRSAPLGTATIGTNARGVIYNSGGNNANIRVQRCYVTMVRTGIIVDLNSDKGVLYESVSAKYLNTRLPFTQAISALNATVKGCRVALNSTAANASVYGTHIGDYFTYWDRQLSTYTWASDVVTVSFTAHGLAVGDKVYLDFTSGGATADGVYTVKTSSTNSYTVALAGSGTSGNCVGYRAVSTSPTDWFTGQGRLHLPLNEDTAETDGYVTLTGTAQFTSAPSLTIPATNDEAVIETQYTVKGHTAFLNAPPTLTGIPSVAGQASTYTWAADVVTVTFTSHGLLAGDKVYLEATSGGLPDGIYTITGITSANVYTISYAGSGTSGNATAYRLFKLRYKIDTGSGYNASYRNLLLYKIGGATTSGNGTITMTDTTGIEVNDYVYGLGVGVDAKVSSVDSATQITVDVNSVATGSNILLSFNHLPYETISASTGFKLKVSTSSDSPGSTMAITYLTIPTITTAASQDNLYPLDTNTLTLTGLKNPTEIRVFDAGTTTEIAGQESVTSGTFSAEIDAGTYPDVDISIISLGYQNTRLLDVDISAGDVSIPIQQVIDRQYNNP